MQPARESYRAHLIVWWAEKIPGTNFWKGKAAISEGYGKLNPNRLEGPDGRFETEKAARDHIFQGPKNGSIIHSNESRMKLLDDPAKMISCPTFQRDGG